MAQQIESKAPITDAAIDQVIKANEAIDENSEITQGGQLRKLVKDLRDRLETEITINGENLGNKVDKEEGKGLSTLDFTQADKESIENFNNWSDDVISKEYLEDFVNSHSPRGEIKDIYDFDGTFLDNFDSSGLGITARWSGWALMNGQNGTPNAQGRVRLTVGDIMDGGSSFSYRNGDIGGETKHKLTLSEMPRHQHSTVHDTEKIGSGNGWWGLNRYDDPNNANDNPNVIKYTDYQGGDAHHENRQPYISVYTVIKIESTTV